MLGKLITFLYKKIRIKSTIRLFKKLKKRNFHDFKYNSDYQFNKLKKTIEIAFNNVPFYKDLDFNLEEFNYSNFQKLPLIDKSIIRNNSSELINIRYSSSGDYFYSATSGGSTGEPVVLYRTGLQAKSAGANYYYALFNNGVSIYSKSVDLWGAERDMYNSSQKFKLKQFLHNNVTLNSFVMSDSIIVNYINRLNSLKPLFIKAYVHSIYEISKYILEFDIIIKFKPIIHCTTGPLYPEMRKAISKAFNNAHVYSYYGSREVSGIATEILGSNGMFVLYDNVFVEILDDNGKAVNKGEEGEIVVTTLNNFYMPLIRYRIGDRAVKGDDLEIGTLLLEKVLGRTLGVIHRRDGLKIDGQFFTSLFFGKSGIKNFQLIQKTLNVLLLNIVKAEFFNEEELNGIINRIKAELGDVIIEVIFCDKINLSSTGKIMYVYSEL